MRHVLGAENGIFLIRGRGRPTVYGGHARLILSIPAPEVSLGSLRARLYMVSHLHRMRCRFEGLSANSLTTLKKKKLQAIGASRGVGGCFRR